MIDLAEFSNWLPLVFWFLMGLSILIYVVLDGYDLGVGILLGNTNDDAHKDLMIASIGPFWDANETWLVLGIGILLVAFPLAHGVILTTLYIPVAAMLLGLILRGVAFDFRAKVKAQYKSLWNQLFYLGSVLTAFSQGIMLGRYIAGFADSFGNWLFSLFVGFCLVAGYATLGATWLIIKTDGSLQTRSIVWARNSLWLTMLGVIAISVITPCMSQQIFEKWFSVPNIFLLAPIPIITILLFIATKIALQYVTQHPQHFIWVPFSLVVSIFILAFHGIAYSLFPDLVPHQLTLWQSAASSEALSAILIGVVIVLPAIIAYTIFSYRVFWGKAQLLKYD